MAALVITLDSKAFQPVLAKTLTQPKWKNILRPYLEEDDTFRLAVVGLRFDKRRRFEVLVAKMEGCWTKVIPGLRKAVDKAELDEEDSLFVSDYDDDEDVNGGFMFATVAKMVLELVEGYKSKHPRAVLDVQTYQNHCDVLVAAFAEAVHELQFSRAGTLRKAILGDSIRRIVVDSRMVKLEEQLGASESRGENLQSKLEHLETKYKSLKLKADDRDASRKQVEDLKTMMFKRTADMEIAQMAQKKAEDALADGIARAEKAEKAEREALDREQRWMDVHLQKD